MNNLQQQPENQIDPVSGLAINCRNCIHCAPNDISVGFDKCKKGGGSYCVYVHMYPMNHNYCNNYSSWSPRNKTISELIYDWISKMLKTT